MSDWLFPPNPTPAIPVRGQSLLYPANRLFFVGRNYAAHAEEMGHQAEKEDPFYFTKSPSAIVLSGTTIPYPPQTDNFHYEMELVVAIGAPAFQIAQEQALDAVYGYACGLDMTRRDLQLAGKAKSRPWDLGKDVEQSAAIAEIVPAGEIGHPTSGALTLAVNGETRQSSDLSLLLNSVAEVISHLSRFYHLAPGDLIWTGTPEGVGPVVPGDRLEGAIEGVGNITLSIAS